MIIIVLLLTYIRFDFYGNQMLKEFFAQPHELIAFHVV